MKPILKKVERRVLLAGKPLRPTTSFYIFKKPIPPSTARIQLRRLLEKEIYDTNQS